MVVHDDRGARQAHRRLGDVVARIGLDLGGKGLTFLGGGGRADQHAVAAGFRRRLDHHLVEVLQHVLSGLVLPAQKRFDVVDKRLLAQIVADHARHVGVDHLVVGHAGARGVGHGHPAGLVDLHDAGHAQQRIGPENLRIEKILAHPAIEHVHPLEPLGGAHVDVAVGHDQIAALDQLYAGLLGQEGVLEIGRVVDAGSEQRGRGPVGRLGGDGVEHVEQKRRVVVHGPDVDGLEDLRKGTLEDAPVGQDVGHARRAAQVVFEHHEPAGLVADEVRAGDVAPHPMRRVQPLALLEIA